MLSLHKVASLYNERMVELRGYHKLILYETDVCVLFEHEFSGLEIAGAQIAQ